jgi:Phage related hypothetical protein (DUF1799)
LLPARAEGIQNKKLLEAASRLVHGFDDVEATTDALAAFGLKPQQAHEPEHCDIWIDNLAAFNVFYRLRTQWNVGMNGAIGLRLEALPLALHIEGVPEDKHAEVIDGVQAMEQETLRLWREKR